MPLPEAELVAVGLEAVLSGAPKWTGAIEAQAEALPGQIGKLVRAFLAQAEPADPDKLPPFDYHHVRALLDGMETDAPELARALFSAIPDPTFAQDLADAATRLAHMLRAKMPRRVRSTVSGDTPEIPCDTDVARFARTWAVACDPLIVLRDLGEQTISTDQARDLEAYYPDLFALAKRAVVDGLIAVKAKRPRWELDGPRERALRILLGSPAHDLGLAADLQALYAATPAAPSPAAAEIGKIRNQADLETPGQKQR